MRDPLSDTPFLVDADNAPFLAGTGLAVPQRAGDGRINLIIGALVGGASLLLLFAISLLRVDLEGAVILVIAAAVLGALVFAAMMLRSGWRSVQSASGYRTRARQVNGHFITLELVDEGSGDWFLKGSYAFEDDSGNMRQGEFSQYRPDLVDKPLPSAGARAVVLVLDQDTYTVL